jgi:hypothetical protein
MPDDIVDAWMQRRRAEARRIHLEGIDRKRAARSAT